MSVLEKQLAEGRILMRLPQFIRKEEKLHRDLKAMVIQYPKTYLSLSWGKQSILLAHAISLLELDIPVVFFDEPDTDIINNFREIEADFTERFPVEYIRVVTGQFNPRGSAKEFVAKNGYDGVIMGLAAHESRARQYTTRKNDVHNIFMYASGLYRSTPLAKWMIMDYAAYIAKYDLPLLHTYHKYGLEARTAAGITPESHSYVGRELLSSSQQNDLDERWRKRKR